MTATPRHIIHNYIALRPCKVKIKIAFNVIFVKFLGLKLLTEEILMNIVPIYNFANTLSRNFFYLIIHVKVIITYSY